MSREHPYFLHGGLYYRRPEPVFTALARKLGWSSYDSADTRPRRYQIPEMSLEEIARHVQKQLGTQNVVVVGDPSLRVQTVGDCADLLSSVLPALRTCDVALVGETPQHDTFEYLRDAMALGMKKGLIMISHPGLEEWGRQDCADWLRPRDPFEVPMVRRG